MRNPYSNVKPDFDNEVRLYHEITESEVVGMYAYNKRWDEGGVITEANSRGFKTSNSYYPTETGDCVYDSLVINGFKVYQFKVEGHV